MSDDDHFYDKRINTRSILKEIRKYLPFKALEDSDISKADQINISAENMIKIGINFLNYRNTIVHHIGSPKKTFEDIFLLCDKANSIYEKFREAHENFMVMTGQFRLTDEQFIMYRQTLNSITQEPIKNISAT